MWNLSKIPKIAHFYWGSQKLSFLRYMSLHSFKKCNPDWEVRLYCPLILTKDARWEDKQVENNGDIYDYMHYVKYHLNIKPIYFDFNQIGLSNDLNEVYKSDFIRYYLFP